MSPFLTPFWKYIKNHIFHTALEGWGGPTCSLQPRAWWLKDAVLGSGKGQMWIHKPEKAPELVKGGSWGPSMCLTTASFYKRHWYNHQILKERCNRRMYTREIIHYLPCSLVLCTKDTQKVTCWRYLLLVASCICSLLGALIALNQTLRHQSTLVDGGLWTQLRKQLSLLAVYLVPVV